MDYPYGEIKTSLNTDILDHLMEGFQLISYDWRYLYVNAAVVRHGKYSKENLLGYTMMEKYPGIENTDLFSVLKACMDKRVSRKMENEFVYPDGSSGWFELNIEPVPEGLFILSTDITSRKKAEDKLQELNETLENKVALRTAELSLRNKELTDSINYAKHIQRSKMVPKKEIYDTFPNSFILFEPKAVISGDFYYFYKNNESVIIASADCTGHGVPGALMSMLCSEKLNDVVLKHHCTGEMLKHLNNGIKSSMRQSMDNESAKDGMDIALCSLTYKVESIKLPNTQGSKPETIATLQYSGANRPLWLIRKGASEIAEIKGTRQSIGGFTEDDQQFEKHEIQLKSGDTFYIFSDGYTDQMGGEKGKKISTKFFKNILISIQKKTMLEQKEILRGFLHEWKADMEQIDDILVIGISV